MRPMQELRSPRGFSLLELVIAVAVILILAAIAIPNISRTVANYKLDSSARAVAGEMQAGRIRAVKTNQSHYVKSDPAKIPPIAFVKTNPASAFVQGDPSVAISSGVTFETTSLPEHQQLNDFIGPNLNVTIKVGTPVGFNARGLPCVANNAAGSWCVQNDPTLPGNPTVGFVWFLKGTQPNAWAAVTVTPGGRVKSWRLTQFDPTNLVCGYLACWN